MSEHQGAYDIFCPDSWDKFEVRSVTRRQVNTGTGQTADFALPDPAENFLGPFLA